MQIEGVTLLSENKIIIFCGFWLIYVLCWILCNCSNFHADLGPFCPVVVTPAKSAMLESERSASLPSPQPAACAPTGADLPLPSNTSAPVAKLRSPKLASSIHQWISRGTSPAASGASPCRKVLKAVLQVSCSERRAKRRLETGDASVVGEETDGVSELCPDAKRSRSSEISHSSSKENKHAVFRLQREGSLSSAFQAGKENSSPKKTDWLSVMSQKLKGSAQPKSPSNKREGLRTPSSPVSKSMQICFCYI